MLNRPVEEIGANERQQGKFAELAAGFGGGVGAWRRIFDDQRPDAEIERDKIKWRQLHPQDRHLLASIVQGGTDRSADARRGAGE